MKFLRNVKTNETSRQNSNLNKYDENVLKFLSRYIKNVPLISVYVEKKALHN